MRLDYRLQSLMMTSRVWGCVIAIIVPYASVILLFYAFGVMSAGAVGRFFLAGGIGLGIGLVLGIGIRYRRCERCRALLAMRLADTKMVKRQRSVRRDVASDGSTVGIQTITETWARTYRCRRCGAKKVREDARTRDIG